MGNIVLLDDLTINKIAAGEVIERPASVIKEMVENSIDAGANNVTVEIKNGGISYIRITDNGKGIARDDVELAFERHATSKIRSADDLQDVKSMGFRGEALASIAAIANVELVTKTKDEDIGTRVLIEGGDILNIEDTACSQGTSITVRNLFYNTPVRYKFLKKDFTESGYIEDVVTRIALVHPEIAIKLINTGKTVIQTNGNGEIKSVIYSIYGKEVAENILPVSYEYEYIKINGVIGNPSIARSNRSLQMFFVNERYIKDKTLSAAVEQGFKGMLPIGKFPFLVLNLEMDPNKVDVNVHPAKLEVRFEEESIAFKAMYHAIKDTLLKEELIPDKEKNKEAKEASKEAFKIQNNILEDIYNERINKEVEKVKANTEKLNSESFVQNDVNVNLNNGIFDLDVMQKLKDLQEELKKEVESNPNLEFTDTYKEMEMKYNSIIEGSISEKVEENTNNDIVEENTIEENNTKNEIENISKEEQENINEETDNEAVIENNEETTEDSNINTIDSTEEITSTESLKDDNNDAYENATEEIVEIGEYNVENITDATIRINTIPLVEETVEHIASNEIIEDEKQESNDIVEEEKKDEYEDAKEKILSFEEMYKQLFGKEPYGGRRSVETVEKEEIIPYDTTDLEKDNISVFEDIEEYNKTKYKFLGIAFNTYILLEIDNELYIMDQHAAHERIMYEQVKKNFYSDEQKNCQMLLLPDIITLTHKEMDIARDNFELFENAGFLVEEFGDNTIKLSGVPDVCIVLDTKELFMETLVELNTVARSAKQEREEKFIATVACKAAVKANMALSKEEVDNLMEKLLELPNPFTCPHGRPTVIKMSKYEIERKFARK